MSNQQILLTPTTYQRLTDGSAPVPSLNPMNYAWQMAKPGETIAVTAGAYPHATFRGLPRGVGAWPIKFRGPSQGEGVARIQRDQGVGGSSSLVLNSKQHETSGDVIFNRLYFEADDRSALFSEIGGFQNVTFQRCKMRGFWKPADPASSDSSKWGARTYDTGNFQVIGCDIGNIYHEHGFYLECLKGEHLFVDTFFHDCRRCAIQIVNRPPPDGTAPGFGDVLIQNCFVVDVCLEDGGGGFAFHFAGGMPVSDISLIGTVVSLGNNSALNTGNPAVARNVTGALSCLDGSPTFPGGLGSLTVGDCNFTIGTINPGYGNARRSSVVVSDVGLFILYGTRIEKGPQAHPICLEIGRSSTGLSTVSKVKIGPGNTIIGNALGKPIRVWEAVSVSKDYTSLDDLLKAHPEWVA